MGYSTDTRTLRRGDIYVAIQGERYDGHHFVADAIGKGASKAIVERAIDGIPPEKLDIVDNAIVHLADLAAFRIRKSQSQVIAITGSVGKTTTRSAITEVLRTSGPVVSSIGNLNTLLGLSLTLVNSDLQKETRLVLEMGASKKGDLADICHYFKPDISVITNVRGVHLEMLGSIEGVQYEKSELVRALESKGIACLNADDPWTRGMVTQCKGEHVFYGKSADAHIQPHDITASVPLLGDHVIYILMAAFCVGHVLGIAPDTINHALSHLKPQKGRLNRLLGKDGSILIDDSYNASPDAVMAALQVLSSQSAKRRVVFLGDMLELGDKEEEAHRDILLRAAENADLIYGCGTRLQNAAKHLYSQRNLEIKCYPESQGLARELASGSIYAPQSGDVILVKGSQGARMERVSRALLSEDVSPESVLPRQSKAWLSI